VHNRIWIATGLLFASLTVQAAMGVQWRTASFGTGIGQTGIWPVDADHDGRPDFVIGGGRGSALNSTWSIVSFNATARRYEIAWQSAPGQYPFPPYGDTVQALRVVESGGTQRVWIGRGDGRVEIVDLVTRQTLQTPRPSSTPVTDFALADADNDGTLDVVAVTAHQTFLFDPGTLALKRTLAYGGSRVAVGNVDDDPELELVLNTGTVLEVNSSDVAVEWMFLIPFGDRIELGDIDADGRDEIVGLALDGHLFRGFDVEIQSLKADILYSLQDIGVMRLIDVTGDGTPEIVYGERQRGVIHAISAVGTELWNIQSSDSGVTDLAAFDADGDGALELVWGAGWYSTAPDHLYVHDISSRALEWQSEPISGPYTAVDIGDVDGDGKLEMVVASRFDAIDGGISAIQIFDASTNALEWSSVGQYLGGRTLKLANVDADPQLEILLGTEDTNELLVIDGLTHQVQAQASLNSGTYFSAIDAADLTGDGIPEVIAGNVVQSPPSSGVFLFVVDATSGALLWQSPALAGSGEVTDVLVTDVGTPGPDIIGVSSQVHVIRWSDHRHISSAGFNYVSAATSDVADNAGMEILAGTNAGSIDVLDGETLELITTHNVCSASVTALQALPTNRVMFTCDDALTIYDLASRAVVESKPAGVGLLGENGSLVRTSVGGHSIALVGGSQAVKYVDDSGNNVPLLTITPVSAHWREPIEVQLSASDADNDPLQFEILQRPTSGTAVWLDRTDGRLRYSANVAGGLRTDTLRIRAFDGYGYSETQALQITVTNTTPNATAARHDLSPGTTTISGQFIASDADGDPLTYSVTRQPTRGTLTFDADQGTFQYTGSGNASGTDSITFAVTDGLSQSEATVEFRYLASTSSSGGSGKRGGGGGAFGIPLLALLAFLASQRRRAHPARLQAGT